MPSITYVLNSARYPNGISGASVHDGRGAEFDVLAALVAGGGNPAGVGGSFSVTDESLISALDRSEAVVRSGTQGTPATVPDVTGPITVKLHNPTDGDAPVYNSGDGLFHNIPVERIVNKGVAGGYAGLDANTRVPPGQLPAIAARMLGVGHSITVDGGGASYPDYAAWIKTAKLLGAERYDTLARGGAILACAEGDSIAGSAHYGGIGRLLQFLSASLYRTSRPYLPVVQFVAAMWGLNDIAWMGPATFQTAFPHALRAALARLRAGRVFDISDASVVYTGASWVSLGAVSYNSGSQVKAVTTNGDSLTITVPADFPGGTIALRFVCATDGRGALWTIAGTGSCAGVNTTFETRNINGFDSGSTRAATGKNLNCVKRLTGLPAGAGTLTVTATTIQSGGFFDCWEIEAPQPPLIALPLQFRPAAYSAYAAWPYSAIGDADITTINNVVQSIAAEFDAYVFTIATDDALNKQQAYFENSSTGDNLHPNDLGHGILTNRFVPAMRAQFAQLPLAEAIVADARYWKLLDGSGDANFANQWVSTGGAFPPASYLKDFITGCVTLRGLVQKTTGAANDIIFTLPVGYRPAGNLEFPVVVYNGSAFQTGYLRVQSNGQVFLVSGGSIAASSFNHIECSFLAEQ